MSRAGSTSRAGSASWEDYNYGNPASGISTGKGKRRESKVIIKNTTYTVIDDEIQLPSDPRGEAKIDFDGNLLGGRRYKLSTFTSPMRSSTNKLYMLSIDAARAAGFRDSLYFFRRNPLVHKLSCSQVEKDRLIELGKLSSNLKSRAVTMVSARNCFKVMGATFVAEGKYVTDDYYEDRAIQEGHTAGEPAWIESYDTEKDTGTLAQAKGPIPAGATGSGLKVLHGHPGKGRLLLPDARGGDPAVIVMSFGGAGTQPYGRSSDVAKKFRLASNFTGTNWMNEYAKNVQETNSNFKAIRKSRVIEVRLSLAVEKSEDLYTEEAEAVPTVDSSSIASTSKLSFADSVPRFENSLLSIPASGPDSTSPLPFLPIVKKKRKFYNPILGNENADTFAPQVLGSTQPTEAVMERLDLVPRIFEAKSSRKLEELGGRMGIASFDVVMADGGYEPGRSSIPGMFDFGVREEQLL